MSKLNELKETLATRGQEIIDRLLEVDSISTGFDYYKSLPTSTQRLAQVGVTFIFAFIFFSIPITAITDQAEVIEEFETQRQLMKDLIRVENDLATVPQLPAAPNSVALESQVRQILTSERLTNDQIVSITQSSVSTTLIDKALAGEGLVLELKQLTVNQVINVLFQIDQISPSLKIVSTAITASSKDPNYQDVSLSLVTLKKPAATTESENEPVKLRKGRL